MQAALLEWLEASGSLARLDRQCAEYAETGKVQAVYKLLLHVDPLLLLQQNAELGNMLLHCPRQFWSLLQKLCHTAVTSLGWLPTASSPSQLLLVLRLAALPSLPGYSISRPSDLPPLASEPRFLEVCGVVVGASLPSKYTQSACFYCTADGCEGGKSENRYIRLHVAGTTESSTIRNDFSCHVCGSVLVEDISFRTLANKMTVLIVPSHALQLSSAALHPSSHHRHQATPILLRDDLCEGVRVGGVYSVIGVPVHQLSESSPRAHVTATLEANNVFPVLQTAQGLEKVMDAVPEPVMDIHRACAYSPWAFSATLAYSFADEAEEKWGSTPSLPPSLPPSAEVAPPGAFHRLKLAMLLSLVSCGSPPPPHTPHTPTSSLHLLAVGSDTSLLQQLLTYGSSFATRSVPHGEGGGGELWGSVRREGGECLVEGGSLVLAEGGVCVVGNLQLLRKEKRERLQRTLERSEVILPLPTHMGGDGGTVVRWPLGCAVWAHSPPTTTARSGRTGGATASMHESLTITKSFADSLGLLVVVCDCPTSDGSDYLTELLTQHILNRATATPTDPPFLHTTFREFLAAAGRLSVSLSPQCLRLLRAFYLASRRVRVSTLHGTDMPVSALDTLSTLAVAHARLSLRSEAREEDGVVAILLYEEALASRYGHSVLSILPSPHFRDGMLSTYIGREFDQQMHRLHCQVLQFCKCHAHGVVGGASPLTPEE